MNDALAVEFLNAVLQQYPNAQPTLVAHSPFEILVAVMLSAQTTDRAVNAITPKLFATYPDAAAMSKASAEDIEPYIDRLGLYRNKAKYLATMSRQLMLRYDGVVPQTYPELTALAGIGRKTATVVRTDAFNIPGIAVDTHVSRIIKGFGIAEPKATPDQIQKRLEALMPENTWIQLHRGLIRTGREWLSARDPQFPDAWAKFKPYYHPIKKERAHHA